MIWKIYFTQSCLLVYLWVSTYNTVVPILSTSKSILKSQLKFIVAQKFSENLYKVIDRLLYTNNGNMVWVSYIPQTRHCNKCTPYRSKLLPRWLYRIWLIYKHTYNSVSKSVLCYWSQMTYLYVNFEHVGLYKDEWGYITVLKY